MTKTNTIRAAALAALVAVPFSSLPAAGPFEVRRAETGQAVGTAPPAATIATAPYDEDFALTFVPADFYYAVYDASGSALEISVQLNPVTHRIRIGFDDGNPTSAAVDAIGSSVTVAPASISANGLQSASIVVVPRDANGVLLGRGLTVGVDASLLWPAQLTGPFVDLGDGSYQASAVASVPGQGTVRVAVEGVNLATLPTITAMPLDPSGSLRDLAINMLWGMTSTNGPLVSLINEAGSGTPQAQALGAANVRAIAALETLADGDFTRDENVLKTDFDAILSLMEGVLESPGALDPQDVRDAMDDLLGIARLIAEWHIERAEGSCGVCDGSGKPDKVCNAVEWLASGDAMRAAISPDWAAVVDAYARAVEWALQAYHGC